MTLAYLDTSAFVKTVIAERESQRLLSWLRDWPNRTSSALLRTEAIRATRRHGRGAAERAREKIAQLELIHLDRSILDSAADLDVEARTLHAIHLASALALGPDLGVVITYDARMARAALELGIETVAP